MILHVLINLLAGSFQRHQQQVITFLLAKNRVLKAQLSGDCRLCLTNTDRWRLVVLLHPLDRQCLQEAATLVTPDTLLQWHKRLIVQKCDGSKYRQQLGRPRVAKEADELAGHDGGASHLGLLSHPRCLGKSRAPERHNDRADRPAVSPYVVHYHHERTPQGLDNHLMAPEPEPNDQARATRAP